MPGVMPTRRAVLGGALAAVAGALTACTGSGDDPGATAARSSRAPGPPPEPEPDPDLAVVARAVTVSEALLEQARTALALHPDLAARLDPVVATHQAHLGALDRTPPAGSPALTVPATSRAPEPTVPPAPAPAPPSPDQLLLALAAEEAAAAERGRVDLLDAGPEVARLLASVAAAQASVAAGLGGVPVTGTAPLAGSAELQPALAAQHAAVFGYGAAGPWLGPEREPAARAAYAAHLARRDDLTAALAAAGLTPVRALGSYDLPVRAVDEPSAVALLVEVEDGLADVWAGVVAAAEPATRTYAALALADSAVRAAGWRGVREPFPGLPERSA